MRKPDAILLHTTEGQGCLIFAVERGQRRELAKITQELGLYTARKIAKLIALAYGWAEYHED